MPDRIGAFLDANRCVTALGLNITRVSYSKAVDVHMLFIEVEGSEKALLDAEKELRAMGYIREEEPLGSILLLEFLLKDETGTLQPVLELIRQYAFNISYISSQADGSGYQAFKMGLFVENGREVSAFMHQAALLCPIRVLDYNRRERILDNTVFYLTFADEISEKLSLSAEEKKDLIVQSNSVMQMLDEHGGNPHKTFEYIGLFADLLLKAKGSGYQPRITRHKTAAGLSVVHIEPPCGSNTTVLDCGDTYICIDSGFSCYRSEWEALLRKELAGFDEKKKVLLLTHADADHAGCTDLFDAVYANGLCLANFSAEEASLPAIREENPRHAPYIRISKILTGYKHPDPLSVTVIGSSEPSCDCDNPLRYTGMFRCPADADDENALCFELYEGAGGHVRGEMIFVERKHRIAFTGDIFVNIKGFIPEQAQFNRLAPYLMTSVDTDPALAKAERDAIRGVLGTGTWTVFGGHGAAMEIVI